MFSLGIALIEICFGRPIDQLRLPDEATLASIQGTYAADYYTATRLLNEGFIMEESGIAYESAVRCCIHGDHRFRTNDLDDDEFRQAGEYFP